MKTVYLLRHAKSSWEDTYLDDYQRPLAPRGLKAAPRMGKYMAREGLIPDRILCSGARRARQTWELVADALGVEVGVEIRPDVYDSSSETLLELIWSLPAQEDSVLLVGHNPTFQHLAVSLAGSGFPDALGRLRSKFPTGALAILDFEVGSWPEVRRGSGHLRDFIRPKALKKE